MGYTDILPMLPENIRSTLVLPGKLLSLTLSITGEACSVRVINII